MALNSINTNVAAYYAQSNIGKASDMASSSISRLSSGDRIVRAADDVAAMSAGTSLRTNVTTLRMALVNTSQGSSLLQVADGALSQVTDILQRQKAIAVQAGAGSLTEQERSFLNQEFTNLTSEIDRIADQTNFNGVTLLDGSLFEKTELVQETGAAASAGGSITVNTFADADALVGETIDLNGQTIEFIDAGAAAGAGNIGVNIDTITTTGTAAAASGTLADAMEILANTLNASSNSAISAAEYTANNNTLEIAMRSGGELGNSYEIDLASFATNANFTVEGRETNTTDVFTLQGGADLGIGQGDTTGVGTIGDSIISSMDQSKSSMTINFTNTALTDFTDGTAAISIDDGAGALIAFNLEDSGTLTATTEVDIENASTKEEYLDAIVNTINSYAGTANNDFVVAQIEARRDGDNIIIESRDVGDIVQTDGATAITASTTGITGAVIAGDPQLANGETAGITTSGVTNEAFTGTIQGFSANFTGVNNVVDLEISVGESTYSASALNVSSDQTVRFVSEAGDYFDIDLQGGSESLNVTNQAGADELSQRLDVAFSSITFQQDREISSFAAAGDILTGTDKTGSLTGSSLSLQGDDFSDVSVTEVRVSAPLSGLDNGVIELDINGVTYRSEGDVGSELGANSVTRFTSLEDASDVVTFRAGDTAIEFDTDSKAAAFQEALTKALGIGEGGDTLKFQVGSTVEDTLQVNIGNIRSETLFQGVDLNVLTAESAAQASEALDFALDSVTAVRAEVGALQSRFDFAAANVESSLQNQDAARGVLLDTDISAESTAFATAQVQLQAGISVLAQANQLPQNLLKLIG